MVLHVNVMDTKQVRSISISEQQMKAEARHIIYENMSGRLKSMQKSLEEILDFVVGLLNVDSWVYMSNVDLYYNYHINAIFPNIATYQYGHSAISKGLNMMEFNYDFANFNGQLMTKEEFIKAISATAEWFKGKFPVSTSDIFFAVDDFTYCYSVNGDQKKWGGFSREEAYHIPIHRMHRKVSRELTPIQVLYLWFRNNMIPESLPKELLDDYIGIMELITHNNNYFNYEHNLMSFNYDNILEDIMENELIEKEEALKDMQRRTGSISISDMGYENMVKELLDCDMIRCDIESYDEKILSDPNRGHWELWNEPKGNNRYTVKLSEGFIARNPIADVKYDGVIGIDFGTKSTVVVYQDNTEHTLPMRIGTGQISKKVEAKHYENPTVMELINLDKFLDAYYSQKGRPNTHWEDLIISHAAMSSMMNSSSTDFYSYFNEFKQWAGDRRKQIRLKDKQNKDILLPPFLEITEGEFNPIEIYAYYIGLYINNMNNGIYLDYNMSFPVTYESTIRKKITDCFERGIRKSLPIEVLEDDDVMKRFRVAASLSEPAAYAICALEEAYCNLDEDEQIYYGIFDFGGGTTDFDYGVWRESESEERKYDYVLECFGSGGDQFLGGENLLELMAFEIFKDNQDKLRVDRISFVLPPEVKRFPGSEVLLSESQEAKLNMRQLMEALRPYWERKDDYENMFEDNITKVTLFTKEGDARVNYELVVDTDSLDEILRARINKGVYNFFEGLRAAFQMPDEDLQRIDIFLAGNSSRSPLVTELFEAYIDQYEEDVEFIVHPPLGFKELQAAQERRERVKDAGFATGARMQAGNGEAPSLGYAQDIYTVGDGEEPCAMETLDVKEAAVFEEEAGVGRPGKARQAGIEHEDYSYITRPTGKTGVAFGLIEGRPGGRVKIVLPDLPTDQNGEQVEIRFKYFIGFKKKQCFYVISDRSLPYGEWVELYDASEEDFTIYYTSLPEALTNRMSILDVNKKNCRIKKVYKDAFIYYRAITPTSIEYVVAKEDGLDRGEYLEDEVVIELQ